MTIANHVYCFDAEWIPCTSAGRLLHQLGPDVADAEVRAAMWRAAGATSDKPRPFLTLAISRVVSISAVHRVQHRDGSVSLEITSWPRLASDCVPEREIIGPFLEEVASNDAQLVGYNSAAADLPTLIQRGIATGCSCRQFRRGAEPAAMAIGPVVRLAASHIDLAMILSAGAAGRTAALPSLNELAAALRIPGKLDHAGSDVVDLWSNRQFVTLTGYNETDACTTYLAWLQIAQFLGLLSPETVTGELNQFGTLLQHLSPSKPHLYRFLTEWRRRRSS